MFNKLNNDNIYDMMDLEFLPYVKVIDKDPNDILSTKEYYNLDEENQMEKLFPFFNDNKYHFYLPVKVKKDITVSEDKKYDKYIPSYFDRNTFYALFDTNKEIDNFWNGIKPNYFDAKNITIGDEVYDVINFYVTFLYTFNKSKSKMYIITDMGNTDNELSNIYISNINKRNNAEKKYNVGLNCKLGLYGYTPETVNEIFIFGEGYKCNKKQSLDLDMKSILSYDKFIKMLISRDYLIEIC